MKTHYDLLGVSRQASYREIGERYRELLAIHITLHGSRPACRKQQLRLRQMREAYLMLSSPTRRMVYDYELKQSEAHRMRRFNIGTRLGTCLLMLGLLLIAAHAWHNSSEGTMPVLSLARAAP